MSTSTTVRSRRALLSRSLSLTDLFALLLLLFPLATAAAALIHTSINIPFEDDYQAIANFVRVYAEQSGAVHKLIWVLTSQHNEYKLLLLHAIVALQYEFTGHTNYTVLELLGDLAVPAVLGLLWIFLARQHRPFKQAIWLFIPPWYLFLSLSYCETLNFAMSEWATLAVIPLALACILCYTSSRPHRELCGAVLLVLAIAALASGFFLSVTLVPVLWFQRRYASALRVVCVTVGMAILYRVRYIPSPPHPSNPAPHSAMLMYPVVFLGDIFTTLPLCTLLGAALLVIFIALVVRGWPRRSPGTFTLALFCLVTSLGVSAGRYSLGLETAMSSRYSMYALLLVCAEYMAVLEMFAPKDLRRRGPAAAAFALATFMIGIWSLDSQANAYRTIFHPRQRLLATHLILWQRHPDHLVLTPDEPGFMSGPSWITWRTLCQPILQREISSGRYIPPVTASDPLPLRPHSPSTLGIEDEPTPTP